MTCDTCGATLTRHRDIEEHRLRHDVERAVSRAIGRKPPKVTRR